MKNKFGKLIAASLSAIVIAQAAFASFALTQDGEGEFVPTDELEYWAHCTPSAVTVYSNSERTEQILDSTALELGQKVYYRVDSADGYWLKSFSVPTTYLDTEYFIYDGSLSFRPVSVLAGDFDKNGKVDANDAIWIIRYCAHWKNTAAWTVGEDPEAGDYDRSGDIDVSDAISILRMLVNGNSDFGGVQTDFEATLDIAHEAGEIIATAKAEKNSAVLIGSADEFKAFWDKADTEIELPESPYDYTLINPSDKYPLDKDALYARYDDAFFAEHDVVIASVETYVSPMAEFDTFKFVNGVAVADFCVAPSGVAVPPYFTLNQIIIVDKGTISTDAEIAARVVTEYGLC